MKTSATLKKLLTDQVYLEANASSNYLAMASWCEITGYTGAATYFFNQSDEERQHMLKIIHFLNGRGMSVQIQGTKAPQITYKSLESILKMALKNEQAVTAAISKIVDCASKEKNHIIFTFLQWFVTEQMHEEEKFETILQKFDLIGRDKLAINEIDKMLGSTQPEGEQ